MSAPAYQVLSLPMEHAKVSFECLRLLAKYKPKNVMRMLMLTGEIEAPPPVQQVAPPNAEANRLKVVITGLVPGTVRELDVPSI